MVTSHSAYVKAITEASCPPSSCTPDNGFHLLDAGETLDHFRGILLETSCPVVGASLDGTKKGAPMPIAQKIKHYMESASWIRGMFEEGIRLKQQYGENN